MRIVLRLCRVHVQMNCLLMWIDEVEDTLRGLGEGQINNWTVCSYIHVGLYYQIQRIIYTHCELSSISLCNHLIEPACHINPIEYMKY